MSAFTFTYAKDKNELLVGTAQDIAAIIGQTPEQTFDNVDALMEEMNAFRSREVIITLVSENESLQKQWNSSYVRKTNTTKTNIAHDTSSYI
ncbi:hypothetical protein [Sinobaca sp. H24]|uniref:hypothetical protein n=1 Tax=Sinobaca sp. H24 TaxID=2923376 RepID=UPI0020793390|nr:hypothetical protein [Sinobaca sp. H24]